MPIDVQVGDVVRLRKPHPCGGYDWQVVRIGADIGLKCQTCDHRVLLTRREFEKRVKILCSGRREIRASRLESTATRTVRLQEETRFLDLSCYNPRAGEPSGATVC